MTDILRRRLLATAGMGAATILAGCADEGPEEGEETPAPEDDGTPTPEDGEETPTPEDGEETPTPEDGEETPTPEDGEETPTPEDGEETPTPEDGEEGAGGNGEAVDEEPDYGDWFDDVDNYEETVDMRGEDEVTVEVGAEGNGGNFAYEPAAIMVAPGTTVVWEWTGEGGTHNVVDEDEEFESELTDEEGFTFEYTFEEAGVYRYVCEPHETQGMKGAVAVEEE